MCSEVTAMRVIIILNKMLCWQVWNTITKDTCIVCGIKYIKLDIASVFNNSHLTIENLLHHYPLISGIFFSML